MQKFFLFLILLTSVGYGVSFDCAKARSSIEKVLCNDDSLDELDSKLALYYKKTLQETRQNYTYTEDTTKLLHYFKQTQREWLRQRNRYCKKFKDDELKVCLQKQYKQRIAELKPYAIDHEQRYFPLKHIFYMDNYGLKLPYEFLDLVSDEKLKKLQREHKEWKNRAKRQCLDRYGILQKECFAKKEKKREKYYFEKLHNLYTNVILKDQNKTLNIKKSYTTELYKTADGEFVCIHHDRFLKKSLQKVFRVALDDFSWYDDTPSEWIDANSSLVKSYDDRGCDRVEETRIYESSSQKILYFSKNVLSIALESANYSGGSHGEYEAHFVNFDRNLAKPITWSMLFGENKAFEKAIIATCMNTLHDLDEVSDKEIIEMAKDRFYFTKDGVRVQFNNYEISGYGKLPTFDIPLNLIEKYMTQEKFNYYFKGATWQQN